MPEEILVRISDDPVGRETTSLANWLRKDADVPNSCFSTVERRPEKGEMGAVVEMIQLLLDPATVSAGISVVVAWLTTRKPHTKMTIKIGRKEVSIESSEIDDPDASARRILRELRK